MREIGQRGGAVMKEEDSKVYLFGYGEYIGELIPSDDVTFLGKKYNKVYPGKKDLAIRLDNGKVVYGCECWWCPEEAIKEFIGSRTIETVSIDDYRKGLLELIK